jgi:hypothetical protein
MSKLPCHAIRMKIKKSVRFQLSSFSLFHGASHQFIAAFGTTCLVKKSDGLHELIGGTVDDHADAREWCSLFAHEVVFTSAPRRNPAFAFAA